MTNRNVRVSGSQLSGTTVAKRRCVDAGGAEAGLRRIIRPPDIFRFAVLFMGEPQSW
jgi:hypothetical protein